MEWEQVATLQLVGGRTGVARDCSSQAIRRCQRMPGHCITLLKTPVPLSAPCWGMRFGQIATAGKPCSTQIELGNAWPKRNITVASCGWHVAVPPPSGRILAGHASFRGGLEERSQENPRSLQAFLPPVRLLTWAHRYALPGTGMPYAAPGCRHSDTFSALRGCNIFPVHAAAFTQHPRNRRPWLKPAGYVAFKRRMCRGRRKIFSWS